MKYNVTIAKDGNTYMASFPDIPEALTCGDTIEEALVEAQAALITAFEFYFEDQRPVPMPSAGVSEYAVDVPLSIWVKVLLLNTMLEQKITQTELAARMGTRKQELQRITNLHHATKIDTLDSAMAAMGKRLVISMA